MRVVQVSVFPDPAGRAPEALLDAWSGLTDPASAARRAGCEVEVVQAAGADRALARDGVPYHFVAATTSSRFRKTLGPWATPVTARVLERLVALRPDLVHLHGLSFPRHTRRLTAALAGVPLVAQDHADPLPARWRRGVHRRGLAGLAGTLFTVRELAEPFLRSGVLAQGLPVFEVLESSSRFSPGDQQAARDRTGLEGDPCLLWVGRLDANKDPLTVLEAFSRAAAALPGARLWMAYGGMAYGGMGHAEAPLGSQVRQRIDGDPVLRARVRLLGTLAHEQVEWALRAADFLVLGSHREGTTFAVIEAFACGTTPLVTDIPSLRRITADGAHGALSPPGDARAMAAAMVAWAGRDRSALRREARAHFERSLSLDALGAQLGDAYQAMLRGGPAPSAAGRSAVSQAR